MSEVAIPKLSESGCGPEHAGHPGWIQPTQHGTGTPLKPLIRCNCGWFCGIGLHHVHADGRVTASFFHTKDGPNGDKERGCEWHVFLKLLDYNGGDFPPKSPQETP